MKLCFPIEVDLGIQSPVFTHFGSAPKFMLVDTETNKREIIDNQDMGHTHGMCSPLKALNGKMVHAVIVGGIGTGAINKLRAMNIIVYQACNGTVQENIELFTKGSLPEISLQHACNQHGGCK